MTRHATDRLVVAAIFSTGGALLAVMGGVFEAALLVAPWAALLVLGLSQLTRQDPTVKVDVATDRLLVDDDVEVTTSVEGATGSVHVVCLPSEGFWRPTTAGRSVGTAGVRDALTRRRATICCKLPATQWGTHDVGHVRVRVTEPYGLFQTHGVVGRSLMIRVHPTTAQLQKLLAPWLVRRVSGAHGSRSVGRGVEFAEVRPYAPGDSLRDINWRVSARCPELWVSQRHPDQATDVVLFVDSFVESGHDAHTVVGLAIQAAVALAESHLGVTDRVGLVDMGGIVRWVSPGTGRRQLQRLTDAMLSTGLWANAGRRDLRGVPAHVLPPRSFVVALTPLLDERFIDALFVLRGGGHDVAVIECAVAGLAGDGRAVSRPPDLVETFWQAERQIVRDRLSEGGVAVATWRAGDHLETTVGELARLRQRLVRGIRP